VAFNLTTDFFKCQNVGYNKPKQNMNKEINKHYTNTVYHDFYLLQTDFSGAS